MSIYVPIALAVGVAIGVLGKIAYDLYIGVSDTSSPIKVHEGINIPLTPPPLPWSEKKIVLEKVVRVGPDPALKPEPAPLPPPPPEKTVEQKIADTSLPLVERLNLRYSFADVKISETLGLISWKNYAGKRVQAPLLGRELNSWKRACTLIEDSMHDVRSATRKKVDKCTGCGHKSSSHTIMAPMDYAGCVECSCSEYKANAS